MAKTPKPPTMLAVGRRRGFETTLQPSTGAAAVSALTPTLFGTGGSGITNYRTVGMIGSLVAGQSVTILSDGVNGFGSTGPVNRFVDPLSDGVDGALIGASSPIIGSYYLLSNSPRFSSAYSRKLGGTSFYAMDGSESRTQLRINFGDSSTNQIRFRFWLYAPVDTALPSCSINGHNASQSSFKWSWAGSNAAMNQTDYCIPTSIGGTSVSLTGNSLTARNSNLPQTAGWTKYPDNQNHYAQWMPYGRWNMVECLVDGVNSRVRISHCAAFGTSYDTRTVPEFWGTQPQFMAYWNLPGWVDGNPTQPNCRLYYSEPSVAIGSGAWGDVILGNNPVYTSCTDLRHGYVTFWSNSQINWTPYNIEDIDLSDGWYLYVRLADGTFAPYGGSSSRQVMSQ